MKARVTGVIPLLNTLELIFNGKMIYYKLRHNKTVSQYKVGDLIDYNLLH